MLRWRRRNMKPSLITFANHTQEKQETMRRLFVIVLILATTCPAFAFQGGDRVLSQWRGSQFWFPGVVVSVDGNMVTVVYDDGFRETRPTNQVKAYDWAVGSRVSCNFKGAGRWYPGTINRIDGGVGLRINYDDGDVEDTTTGRCRSR
jgi:hypothetical protein